MIYTSAINAELASYQIINVLLSSTSIYVSGEDRKCELSPMKLALFHEEVPAVSARSPRYTI